MTAIPYATPTDATKLPFKDRRVTLRVAGIVLILLGSASGCFSILMPVGMLMSAMFQPPPGVSRTARVPPPAPAPVAAPAPPVATATAPTTSPVTTAPASVVAVAQWPPAAEPDYRTMAFALAMYVLATVLFIWTGAAALRLSRWVRPVMLIVGWTWLASGAIGTLYYIFGTPSMRQVMESASPPGSPRPPPAVYKAIAWGAGTFMALFMVALPALLVWAFSRKGVRETVEYFDPRVRWTDACPTPALAVSVWLAAGAVACVLYCAYAVMPLFGFVVTGAAAVVGLLLLAAVFAALAWLTYRLRPAGWWGALVIYTLWAASMAWTFSHIGWYEFYRKAGYTPQQVDAMMRFSGPYENGSLWMVALWSVLVVGYLLYVRRYFAPPQPAAA